MPIRPSLLLSAALVAACSSSASSPASAPEQPTNVDASTPTTAEPASAAPAPVAAPALSVPSQGPGLAVGQHALPFSLRDQAGTERPLDTWLGQDKLVAVVFFRSADW